MQARNDLGYSVSATTRTMRERGAEGVDYHFLTREEFERRRDARRVPRVGRATAASSTERCRARSTDSSPEGRHAVLDIEVEGARQIRKNLSEFAPRVRAAAVGRSADRAAEGAKHRDPRACCESGSPGRPRSSTAVAEYDYAIVNDDLVTAVAQVAAILDAEGRRSRGTPQNQPASTVIERLRRDVVQAAGTI